MIVQSTLHRWGHSKRCADTHEIAIHKVKGHGVGMIVDPLRESVREPSKAAHVHPHREVLALDVVGTYVLRIGILAHRLHLTANADRRGVSRLVFKGSAVNLLQLSIVNIRPECTLNRFQICLVGVYGDLYSILDSTGAILHEVFGPVCSASTDEVTNDQLRIRVDSDPRPNIAPANFFFRGTDVPSLCSDVCPYLVTLKTMNRQLTNVVVVIYHARLTEIDQKFSHGVPRNPCDPRSGTDAVSFDQLRYNPDTFLICQPIHNEHYA